MAQIFLVRHGQASFGSENYDQLSPLGAEQARHLGRWWAERDMPVARVVTGAMQRHHQTAAACLASWLDLPESALDASNWQQDAGLNEYNHHEVLARHTPEFDDPRVVKRFLMDTPDGKHAFQQIFAAAITRWISGEYDSEYSETWRAFQQRCVQGLQTQMALQDGAKHIVIFTSGGTISAICQHLLGFEDARFAGFNWSLVNTGVTRLLVPEAGPGAGSAFLTGLNQYAHLEVLNQSKLITFV